MINRNWYWDLIRTDSLLWLFSLFLGLAVSYCILAFRHFIHFLEMLWLSPNGLEGFILSEWNILFFITPIIGGICLGVFLHFYVPQKRGSGVADVIEARVFDLDKLTLRQALHGFIISGWSLGMGASAGREGPAVHIGACLGAVITKKLSFNVYERRILMACGVAAAVSASFNVPFAGILFAHEIVLRHYSAKAMAPNVIASVVAALVVRHYLGDDFAFHIPDVQVSHLWEMPAFALLGVLCALLAVLFQLCSVKSENLYNAMNPPILIRPVISGICLGIVGLFIPQILGLGYHTLNNTISGYYSAEILLLFVLVKIAMTAITLAGRFGGGVFTPSLVMGGMLGAAFGQILVMVFPYADISVNAYTLVGMGATAAAVLGAPISTAMIILELTGGHRIAIAILLTVSIAVILHYRIAHTSFFYMQLKGRGVDIEDGVHREIVKSITLQNVINTIESSTNCKKENDKLACALLNDGLYLDEKETLEQAIVYFSLHNTEYIVVTRQKDDIEIIGILNKLDLLQFYIHALEEHNEEHN